MNSVRSSYPIMDQSKKRMDLYTKHEVQFKQETKQSNGPIKKQPKNRNNLYQSRWDSDLRMLCAAAHSLRQQREHWVERRESTWYFYGVLRSERVDDLDVWRAIKRVGYIIRTNNRRNNPWDPIKNFFFLFLWTKYI